MKIESRLKGSLAQAVVKAVFSHWRYRVIPFGIEETLREVVTLDKEKYKELRLPKIIRTMPDYIIASMDMNSVHLVEVKFRNKWSTLNRKRLFNELQPQAKHWGALLVVFVFKNFLDEGACIKCLSLQSNPKDNYLEVISSEGTKNWNDVEEKDFRDLSEFFNVLTTDTADFKKALKSIVSAEQDLSGDTSDLNSTTLIQSPPSDNATPPPRPIPKLPPISRPRPSPAAKS
ncbi:hypothetical protein [Methylobacterium sp. Leaf106]|uniref:hypothetical protein n=1 Tax=Methylobacterium sp. Leaf106 TaxID=1736255 RepID=UPI0012E7E852|nr:hypothetical protein [Methylobacterium sp. Leaf106]